jgi:acetyltransferase-like isoleucine patch superfamily enzyme
MDEFQYLGQDVTIYPLARILGRPAISIGCHAIIDDFVFVGVHRELIIGNYVHIASHSSITGGGRGVVSDFCNLSSGVRVFTGTDNFHGESLVGPGVPPEFRKVERGEVVLEPHVVLGANVVVLPNIHIGEGAAVGAGSVVIRDLAPWNIYAGVPARLIRARPREKIERLEAQLYAQYGRPRRSFRSVCRKGAS